MKVKDFGQVFTPKSVVTDILNISDYYGEKILNKHVIDNSCGDGAFLIEIVDRYIKAYFEKNKTYDGIKKDLEEYVHGIEYDPEIWEACLLNLKLICDEYNIQNVKFDIVNDDTLKVEKYNRKMDFVLGNPPYVRVHNLNEQYNSVKQYSFCESGMTDLYIVFYEIGLRMLNDNGILCYISPNSFYNSLAGNKLREYIKEKQTMEVLMDLGHYQPFSVTTYTTICKICKGSKLEACKYFKYDIETGEPKFISNIKYADLFVDNNIILSSDNAKYFKYLNYNLKKKLNVEVKNGFATLNDKIFIQNGFDFEDNLIDVIKASTGQWKKCIYPYDKDGKLIPFSKLGKNVQKYFEDHKSDLIKEGTKVDSEWYAFGRSQAINDVKLNKIAINTCIKDIDSIKLNLVESNKGLYSGLYMLTKIPFEKIKEKICSQAFIEYLKLLNKCKSGGYYTFSSKDLSKYINCCMEEETNE
jgi:adenine-specific DNA-methyltransferase